MTVKNFVMIALANGIKGGLLAALCVGTEGFRVLSTKEVAKETVAACCQERDRIDRIGDVDLGPEGGFEQKVRMNSPITHVAKRT